MLFRLLKTGLLVAGLSLAMALNAAESTGITHTVRSADGLAIAFRMHAQSAQPTARLVVLSPGFAQHSGTKTMRHISNACAQHWDALCLDYRGNGLSEGRYYFGAQEWQDLQAVLQWARPRYKEVAVMGFSLGSYTALRVAAQSPELIDHLALVSCPTRLEEIVSSGGALLNPWVQPFQGPYKIEPDNSFFFRWGWVFGGNKPQGADLAKRLKLKPGFLVGEKDALVFPRLSRAVFEASPKGSTWTSWPQGFHAEKMYLQEPERFMQWLKDEWKEKQPL
jgi:pimeloyl-ACP methyl ester carboxylesterase